MSERFRGYYPVVVDVETAGFNSETDALLEIAAIALAFDDHGTLKPLDPIARFHLSNGASVHRIPSYTTPRYWVPCSAPKSANRLRMILVCTIRLLASIHSFHQQRGL